MRNDPKPLETGPAFTPDRPDMPNALRLKLDLRIHRQRLALHENWMIVDQRLWARTARPMNRYLQGALRLLRENRELKKRLAEAQAALAARGPHDYADPMEDMAGDRMD
jgi:hypothetical protein